MRYRFSCSRAARVLVFNGGMLFSCSDKTATGTRVDRFVRKDIKLRFRNYVAIHIADIRGDRVIFLIKIDYCHRKYTSRALKMYRCWRKLKNREGNRYEIFTSERYNQLLPGLPISLS